MRATRHSAGDIDSVWDLVATAARWKDWGAFPIAELEREGDPAPDGVGAIRRLGARIHTSREEVVVYDPPTRLGYVMLSGLPISGYRSDVMLTPAPGGGTDIEWTSSFDARPLDGWFWAGVLKLMIGDFARRVAKAAG